MLLLNFTTISLSIAEVEVFTNRSLKIAISQHFRRYNCAVRKILFDEYLHVVPKGVLDNLVVSNIVQVTAFCVARGRRGGVTDTL